MTGPNISGEINLLVPPVPVTIEVSSPGHKGWHYKQANSGKQDAVLNKHGDALHLASSQPEELTITLSPNK